MNGVNVLPATYHGDGRREGGISGDTTVYGYPPGSWNPAYVKDLAAKTATDKIFAGGLLVGKVQGAAISYCCVDRLRSMPRVIEQ